MIFTVIIIKFSNLIDNVKDKYDISVRQLNSCKIGNKKLVKLI